MNTEKPIPVSKEPILFDPLKGTSLTIGNSSTGAVVLLMEQTGWKAPVPLLHLHAIEAILFAKQIEGAALAMAQEKQKADYEAEMKGKLSK